MAWPMRLRFLGAFRRAGWAGVCLLHSLAWKVGCTWFRKNMARLVEDNNLNSHEL